MRPGRAADHSPPSSAAVMKDIYPPSGPHRACNGIALPVNGQTRAGFAFSWTLYTINTDAIVFVREQAS